MIDVQKFMYIYYWIILGECFYCGLFQSLLVYEIEMENLVLFCLVKIMTIIVVELRVASFSAVLADIALRRGLSITSSTLPSLGLPDRRVLVANEGALL